MLVAGVCASAVVYGEMRVRTGSIWPGVVLHSRSNAVATPLLVDGYLTFTGHGDVLASPVPSAVVIMVCFAVTGVILARRRNGRALGVDDDGGAADQPQVERGRPLPHAA